MDPQAAITHILDRLKQELPDNLHYHGHHHTLDVLESVKVIAASENVNAENFNLLLVAAAYHDCGFLTSYKEHEAAGCEIARATLPGFGFGAETIDHICSMILATKVPQGPKDTLAEILCDADLDYLGTDRFKPIGDQLYKELRSMNAVSDIKAWNQIQLKFLTQHSYYTRFGKEYRQPKKEKNIQQLKAEMGL